MDLVDFKQEVYEQICDDYRAFTTTLDVPDITFIPVSALKGDNVVDLSNRMPWYHGKSLLEFLETVHVSSDRNFDDLRFPVQYVIRPTLDYRGFAGKVASGVIRVGDEVMALPSQKKSKVTSILTSEGEVDYAFPPQSASFTLADEIDISRGEMVVHANSIPHTERHFEAMMVWMDEKPMDSYTQFYIKHNAHSTKARIDSIKYKVDVNTLEQSEIDHFELNEIGRVVMTTTKPLLFDPYKKNRQTGSFILIDPVTHNTVAVGMILDKLSSKNIQIRLTEKDKEHIVKSGSLISRELKEKRYDQKAQTIWISGLHGSGKNELAYSLEKELFDMGKIVVVLDGKSVRSGLSKELDYSPGGRAEHMRRVAYLCKLLNDQGIICICSFISPDKDIREEVKEIIGSDRYQLVYLEATMEYCRQNDNYGIYRMADQGKLDFLPGIDMDYDIPTNPSLKLTTDNKETNLQAILEILG